MATYEYYSGNNPLGLQIPFNVNGPLVDELGQTFTVQAGEAHSLNRVRIKIARYGTPGTIYVKIYATDGETGYPTGDALGTSSVNGDTLSESATYVSFYFDPYIDLTAETTYAIVLTVPTGTYEVSGNGIYWYKGSSAGYIYGIPVKYNLNETPTWTEVSETDLYFYEYGETAPEKPINPTPTDSDTDTDFTDGTLTWEDGGSNATSYDVRIGATAGGLVLVSEGQAGLSYELTEDNITDYFSEGVLYWRIDAVNEVGTTTGDVWDFQGGPPFWIDGYGYIVNDTTTGSDDNTYICIVDNTSSTDDKPITGANWADYWLLGDELMVRMIPFIYSSEIAYECEFGGSYIRFFYNGEALMDGDSHVEVVAPYLQTHLFELNYEQVGDVMWITHPSYASRKLTRTSATAFSLDEIEFKKGPFLLRNDLIDPDVQDTAKMSISGLTIATATAGAAGVGTFTITSDTDISSLFPPNKPFAVYGSTSNDANYTVHATTATTYVTATVTIYVNEVISNGTDDGVILVVGATDTLVSTGEIFDDADHVGALFKLVHPRLLKEISLSGAGTTKAIEVKGTARYVSTGTWLGTWHVQRNQNSSGWENYRTYKGLTLGARNDSLALNEKEDNIFYRLNAVAGISTGFGATLTIDNPIQEGIVEITAVTDANNATVEIIKLPASTVATRRWAEGAWSPLRGYPASVTFSRGNRCVYAGESPIVSQIVPD